MQQTSRVLGALGARPRPLLVTGVPRSGTTWLARQLAGAPGCAMTGREPMNPKPGQYRLGGTLDGWVRLREPSRRQRLALRLAYGGLSPRVYGKYGHRQWAAASPFTRTVVKDPFALLSLGAVATVTFARPVLVYRHPAAVLSSYRRMGWSPDLSELSSAVSGEPEAASRPSGEDPGHTESMAWFWSTLNAIALRDLDGVDGALVVSHEELASGGEHALATLFAACDLEPPAAADPVPTRPAPTDDAAAASTSTPTEETRVLHRLDRPSQEVATAWRSGIDDAELEVLEALAGPTFERLQKARLRVEPTA